MVTSPYDHKTIDIIMIIYMLIRMKPHPLTLSLSLSLSLSSIIVWMGDLNYRINTSQEMTADIVKAMADSYQLHTLLKHDQLHQQQKKGLIFTQFLEGAIDFKPTYKYDPSTNSWYTGEKNRAPAWCDRVLYYSQNDLLNVVNYRSYTEMIISDHKPVSALFDARVSNCLVIYLYRYL